MNKITSNRKVYSTVFLLIFTVQLFAPLTTTLRPQIASAAENPCQLVPESSPDISTDYGGIELNTAAEFLANMDDITGAYYDEESNRIVFIGTATSTLPEFNKDDLAVAIRAVIFNNSIPTVSINMRGGESRSRC